MAPVALASAILLAPLGGIIVYTDVRHRRIPNAYVLVTLVGGLLLHLFFGGPAALLTSVAGCGLAFGLMLVLHLLGGMGAGDVKFFAAVGSVVGLPLVLPAFFVTVLAGLVLALFVMIRAGVVRHTLWRVLNIFGNTVPLVQAFVPTCPVGPRHTIPYGAAIAIGGLASLFLFRA